MTHEENQRDSTFRLQVRRRELLDMLKISIGCADCGYRKHASALEWDHLPGTEKLGSVGNMWSSPLSTVLREIAKCDLVCANCHRVRTAERGGWVRSKDLPHLSVDDATEAVRLGWYQPKSAHSKGCDRCGTEMPGRGKFCSSSCRSQDWQERQPEGPGRGSNRLPVEVVEEILSTPSTYGSAKILAEKFGIHPGTVSKIRRTQTRRP